MTIQKVFVLILMFTSSASVMASDPEAIKAKATSVCASCHGVNGISAADAFPNLQGQKAAYLVAALNSYRDNSRKAPVMNNMAANLNDDEIQGLATYFSNLKP